MRVGRLSPPPPPLPLDFFFFLNLKGPTLVELKLPIGWKCRCVALGCGSRAGFGAAPLQSSPPAGGSLSGRPWLFVPMCWSPFFWQQAGRQAGGKQGGRRRALLLSPCGSNSLRLHLPYWAASRPQTPRQHAGSGWRFRLSGKTSSFGHFFEREPCTHPRTLWECCFVMHLIDQGRCLSMHLCAWCLLQLWDVQAHFIWFQFFF